MQRKKVQRTSTPPPGLLYVPDFISEEEEIKLLDVLAEIPYHDFVLQGVAAKRKVKRYGFSYEFYTPIVEEEEPFPPWLAELRDRAAPIAGLTPDKLEQALVARYTDGAGIGWHRDAPAFGPTVVGISFNSDDIMRFRRVVGETFEHFKQPISRRSLYVISGPARSVWQHSIAPAKSLRYSITFRTVNSKYKAKPA